MAHLVYISIVGIDRVPLGYYRTKLAVERLIEESGLGWTVLRTTQFHDLVLRIMEASAKLPVMVLPAGVSDQPIEVGRSGGPAGGVGRRRAGGAGRRHGRAGGPHVPRPGPRLSAGERQAAPAAACGWRAPRTAGCGRAAIWHPNGPWARARSRSTWRRGVPRRRAWAPGLEARLSAAWCRRRTGRPAPRPAASSSAPAAPPRRRARSRAPRCAAVTCVARRSATRAASASPPARPTSPPRTTQPGSRIAATAAAPDGDPVGDGVEEGRRRPVGHGVPQQARPRSRRLRSRTPGRAPRRVRAAPRRRPASGSRPRSRWRTAGTRCPAPAGSRSRPVPPEAPRRSVPSRTTAAPTPSPSQSRTKVSRSWAAPSRCSATGGEVGLVLHQDAAPGAVPAGRRRGGGARRAGAVVSRSSPVAGSMRPGAPMPTVCSRRTPPSPAARSTRATARSTAGPVPVSPPMGAEASASTRAEQVGDDDGDALGAHVERGEVGPVGDDPVQPGVGAAALGARLPDDRDESGALEALDQVGDRGPGQAGELLQLVRRQRALRAAGAPGRAGR